MASPVTPSASSLLSRLHKGRAAGVEDIDRTAMCARQTQTQSSSEESSHAKHRAEQLNLS